MHKTRRLPTSTGLIARFLMPQDFDMTLRPNKGVISLRLINQSIPTYPPRNKSFIWPFQGNQWLISPLEAPFWGYVGGGVGWLAIFYIYIGSMYGIFTYIWLIFMVNVGEYASPMDPMGYVSWLIWDFLDVLVKWILQGGTFPKNFLGDPPNGFGWVWTGMMQGCFGGPHNSAVFEGSGFLGFPFLFLNTVISYNSYYTSRV